MCCEMVWCGLMGGEVGENGVVWWVVNGVYGKTFFWVNITLKNIF